ncbi:CPBP family intramembrane metalloprotease [Bacillus sp. FJAT-42376]|uniref:CPBP family intramembrane glutamic endopeptidase n=1 Tax=Bacillus sp. FJAT-42376 TaxID=2014076 RepID=UPI000F50F8F6|nr:CPBP family intramembrane glutamic endopeptidase [Bacillus sp. FJAT-42376]AZB41739.1 CPBP family intramembrane metalloprotease [Bacillus sp. FJAT-42376]
MPKEKREENDTAEGAGLKNTRPSLESTRPFGAHIRMSWWKPLAVIVVPSVALVVVQVLFRLAVGLIEGSDEPLSPAYTPLRFLSDSLSIGVTGVLAVLLLAWMAKVPWRSLLSSPRAFDRQRFVQYLIGAALLVSVGIGVIALVAPEAPGWTTFGFTGTTMAMLVVTFLFTPIQSAGEELMYRSAVMPTAASWVRPVLPALAIGLLVSSLHFAVMHGSTDPWLFGYFFVVGASTALIAIISRGIEASIAFHVANNVMMSTVNSLMAGGKVYTLDRSTETGDASLLILAAVNIAMVALVWMRERRAGVAKQPGLTNDMK